MFLLATNCSTLTNAVAVFILKQPRWKTDAVVIEKMILKGQIVGKPE